MLVYLLICIAILLTPTLCLPNRLFSKYEDDFRFVAYHDLLSTAKRFSDHNVTTFSRIFFDDEKSSIILGARNRIYRLSLTLDLIQRIEWDVNENVFETCLLKGQRENDCQNYIMSIHEYDNKLLICSTYAFSPKCTWRSKQDLKLIKEEDSAGRSPYNPNSNITTLISNGKMYIGSTVDFSSTDSAILRADLTLENSKILRSRQFNENELFQPNFVGSFEHDAFIYFIFREISIEAVTTSGTRNVVSRIARVCKNDLGGIHLGRDNWSSFQKARLNCSLPGNNPFYFDEVQDISYLPEDEELFAIFTTPENSIHGSAICVFNMSSIEKAFNGPLKYQDNVQGSTVWKVKQQEETFSCKKLMQRDSQSLLNSPRYQLMNSAVQPMHLNPLYVEKLEIFTRISVLKLDTKLHEKVTVIFIASLEYILKISILPRTKESCLIEILELEKGITKIESLKYIKASDSLYVGTSSSFYQIPIQRCSRHKSRISCLNANDPSCGWNDLQQACGTAPQNNPLVSHFYQNATTCPILSTPVDGSFSAWSQWFKCAKSGDDPITGDEETNIDACLCRIRTCNNPAPKNGGKDCKGNTIMVSNCTVNGGWSEWSAWSACSQTCGIAIKIRRRTCTNPKPKYGGRTCVGVDRQEIYCTDLPPCALPAFSISIDGGWGDWTEWSECSAPCGGGYRFRKRKCNDPEPQNNGLDCIGCNVEYELCNKQNCEEVKKMGPFTPWLIQQFNKSTLDSYIEKRFRFQCKATGLSDPSALKISLFKEESRSCQDGACHRTMNDVSLKPSWSCWSDFSACSVSCGVGRRVRYRKCLNSNGDVFNDKDCGGSSVQEETCEMPSCDGIIRDKEIKNCDYENVVTASSISSFWITLIIIVFLLCIIVTFIITKYLIEKKIKRLRTIQGSPHWPKNQNQYTSLPLKDFSENNKPKRQSSFSGSHSKVINGTLNKSNNNLFNQNTPKILKYQNDTDSSTLKRNSALNNMRLKQIDDDMDKY